MEMNDINQEFDFGSCYWVSIKWACMWMQCVV